MNTLITYQSLNFLAIVIGAAWVLFTYNKQQKFKRVDNLNKMWEKFFLNEKNLKLFVLMDKIEKGAEDKMKELEHYSEEDKFSFLALLDEVAHYAYEGEIADSSAIYKFQWHFHYVFINEKTKEAFWKNIGGKEEFNDISSWEKSVKFAKQCNK